MTRTRASAKKAGSSFERSIADYLAKVLEDNAPIVRKADTRMAKSWAEREEQTWLDR